MGPIQTLELAQARLPSALPLLALWQTALQKRRFALHRQTWCALLEHYQIPELEPPAAIELHDDLPPGVLQPLPPDPVHPFVALHLLDS